MNTYSVNITDKGLKSMGYQNLSASVCSDEIVSNAISAAGDKQAKVIVNFGEKNVDGKQVITFMCADYGCGMTEDQMIEAMQIGCKSGKGRFNKFGLGLKNALLGSTKNENTFYVASKTENDEVGHIVSSPLRTRGNKIADCNIAELVSAGFIKEYGMPSTVVYMEMEPQFARSYVPDPCRRGRRTPKKVSLQNIIRAYAEHLVVNYGEMLRPQSFDEDPKAQIFVPGLEVFDKRSNEHKAWTRPLIGLDYKALVPSEMEETYVVNFGRKGKVPVDFSWGYINAAAREKAFLGVEPLKYEYQGNMATSGYDVFINGQRHASHLIYEIWDKERHPSMNHIAGRFILENVPDGVLGVTNNKSAIDNGDPTWALLFSHVQKSKKCWPICKTPDLRVKTLAAKQAEEVRKIPGAIVIENRPIGESGTKIHLYVEMPKLASGETPLYLYFYSSRMDNRGNVQPAQVADFDHIISAWAGLVNEGKQPTKAFFVAPRHNANVTAYCRNVLSFINEGKEHPINVEFVTCM